MWPRRRKHPRVPTGAKCWCEAEGVTLYAKIVNVSQGGAFVRTFAPLEEGRPTRVKFTLATEGREIAAEAVVVWRRVSSPDPALSPGMGLKFVGLEESCASELRAFVARCLADGTVLPDPSEG